MADANVTSRVCSVEGCDQSRMARGWCRLHYMRWYHSGDVNGPPGMRRVAKKGEVDKWVESLMKSEVDSCVEWPFWRTVHGYGEVSLRGGRAYAHRVVLEKKLGREIEDGLLACHSCGNGASGCVNPKHLYEGTAAQNNADTERHKREGKPPAPAKRKKPRA